MFIRETIKKDKNTKKIYYSFQLVESYRTERGPRQRILLTIGHNEPLSKADRKLLANRIEELMTNVQSLFDYPDHIESLARSFAHQLIKKKSLIAENEPIIQKEEQENKNPDFETIDLNSIEHNNCRTVGLESISLETIYKLQIDKKLKELGFTKREIEVAIGSIIGRLVNPGSERATHFWLQNNSALDELLGCNFHRLSLDQLYEISDKLLQHKTKIESHLALIEEDLFSLDNTIVLYDLTNTYLEGTGCLSAKAKRGRSKEKRSDCPLVCLGLVLNQEGFPLRSSIYEGNISEPSTLQGIIGKLNKSKNASPPVIVLDAGIATEKNLEWLREQGQPYIVCTRSSSEPPMNLKENYDFIREKNSNVVKASLVKKEGESGELELFCHSTSREHKEKAIKSRFQLYFEEELKKLNEGLNKKGCTKKYEKVVEKIGRLKQQYSRISRFYKIEVEKSDKGLNAAKVSYTCDTQSLTDQYSGFYCIRCWGLDWNADRLWKTYVTLTKVEDGFRCLKSDLGLRPIFHKYDHRIDGHLFITLLAYHVMQSVLYQLSLKDISIRWQTLRDIMASQTRVTSTFLNDKGQTIHVRSSTQVEPMQKEIYMALDMPHQPGSRIKTKI